MWINYYNKFNEVKTMENNVFEKAAQAYVDVMNTATEMFKVHQESLKNQGKQFNIRVALNQLDVIIQYSRFPSQHKKVSVIINNQN